MLWNSPLSSFKFGLQTGSKRLKSSITEMWLSLWVRGSYTIEVARPKNKMSRCWRRPPQWDFLRSSWVHYFFPPDTENNFLNAIVNRLTTKCLISKKPFQQTQTWLIYIKTKTKQKQWECHLSQCHPSGKSSLRTWIPEVKLGLCLFSRALPTMWRHQQRTACLPCKPMIWPTHITISACLPLPPPAKKIHPYNKMTPSKVHHQNVLKVSAHQTQDWTDRI